MFAGTVLAAWDAWLGEAVPKGLPLVRVWHSALTVLVYGLFAALIYRFLAPIRIVWKDAWTGAVVFAVLSGLGQKVLGWYLAYTTISTLYGAAGSLVVILLWFYYSWLVFLLGVEFTIACHHHRHPGEPGPAGPGSRPEESARG
jgi:membrane protein